MMSDLLSFAVEAHGGLDRWNAFTKLRAEVSIAGVIWGFKQQTGLLLLASLRCVRFVLPDASHPGREVMGARTIWSLTALAAVTLPPASPSLGAGTF